MQLLALRIHFLVVRITVIRCIWVHHLVRASMVSHTAWQRLLFDRRSQRTGGAQRDEED